MSTEPTGSLKRIFLDKKRQARLKDRFSKQSIVKSDPEALSYYHKHKERKRSAELVERLCRPPQCKANEKNPPPALCKSANNAQALINKLVKIGTPAAAINDILYATIHAYNEYHQPTASPSTEEIKDLLEGVDRWIKALKKVSPELKARIASIKNVEYLSHDPKPNRLDDYLPGFIKEITNKEGFQSAYEHAFIHLINLQHTLTYLKKSKDTPEGNQVETWRLIWMQQVKVALEKHGVLFDSDNDPGADCWRLLIGVLNCLRKKTNNCFPQMKVKADIIKLFNLQNAELTT